jgi:DNA polymerase-1
MFVAEAGKVFISADYSSIEWVLTMWDCAKLSGQGSHHEQIVDKFTASQFDPHRYLASFVYNVPETEVTAAQRKTAKPYTHGYNYDGSPIGLARAAGHSDAVGIKVCKAHDAAFQTRPWKDYTVALAKKQRYVQTAYGWRRWTFGDTKGTEILATRIQGTAADLCKWVLKDIFETLPGGWEVLTQTHDSVMLQVPEPEGDQAELWLKAKMEQRIPWLDNRSWRCETHRGRTWRDCS